MTYQDTLDWMFAKLPMYQNVGASALKHKLDNIINFCNYLQQPQTKFKSIHVAGTNGKGSSSHMLASVLQEAGYRVGLYTSPHLKDFRERIKINGEMISEKEVIHFISNNKSFLDSQQLSFFEMTVGMAFHYFASQEVDVAIIEVGLGGRLDSTNIINPVVSLITNIGFDHTAILGDTLAAIASEKAGIIKKNTPVVISEFHEETAVVFKQVAQILNAPIYFASEADLPKLSTDLLGDYQQQNMKGVYLALQHQDVFQVTVEQLTKGLLNVVLNTGLMGRWQILNKKPLTITDTAHNKEGLTIVTRQLKKQNFDKLHLVLGFVSDKDVSGILELFPQNAEFYFSAPKNNRAFPIEQLALIAQKKGFNFSVYSSILEAYENAKKNAVDADCIYIGGSTFVVAEIV